MKKILIAAILPMLFFACAKEEETNPAFRPPTCEDTTDEGRFEKFTLPESAQLLQHFKNVPDAEIPGIVDDQFISNRILFNRNADYNPYISYKLNRAAKIFVAMPFPNQPEQYYWWVVTATDTSVDYKINLFQLREQKPQLQTGCYRLYYMISDTDTGTVFTKGHYDLQIKN